MITIAIYLLILAGIVWLFYRWSPSVGDILAGVAIALPLSVPAFVFSFFFAYGQAMDRSGNKSMMPFVLLYGFIYGVPAAIAIWRRRPAIAGGICAVPLFFWAATVTGVFNH